MNTPTVAIVGRPNVGKSTLFNRITGGRRAIVDETPGVTRDRHFAAADWAGKRFWLVDTGGWVADKRDHLSRAVREQVKAAVDQSDIIVLVVDVQAGVHPADLEVAELLRPLAGRVLVAANKADNLPNESNHLAFHELGLGDPQPVSAATGKGTGDLLDALAALLVETPNGVPEDAIQVAVVGRPNVGKSSLMNRLLGEERSVVAPEAGTTRDAVDSLLRYNKRCLNFIDTAGLRKRSKVEDEIEFYSTLRTQRAVERADICVLVVDATDGIEGQDMRIANQAWEKGASLIVAVNKWDLIPEKDTGTAVRGERAVADRAPFFLNVPFLYVSALTGFRVHQMLNSILQVAGARERRVETAEVNRVLERLVARTQPPQAHGKEVKLLYASQTGTKPPRFAIVSNRPESVPESYRRYLEKGFRAAWDFTGAPIRLKFRRKKSR